MEYIHPNVFTQAVYSVLVVYQYVTPMCTSASACFRTARTKWVVSLADVASSVVAPVRRHRRPLTGLPSEFPSHGSGALMNGCRCLGKAARADSANRYALEEPPRILNTAHLWPAGAWLRCARSGGKWVEERREQGRGVGGVGVETPLCGVCQQVWEKGAHVSKLKVSTAESPSSQGAGVGG